MENRKKSYIKMPVFLFEDPVYSQMSTEGKLLYAFLLDRSNLSQRNGSMWITTGNEVFVYFTLRTAQVMLGCGHDRATAAFRELEGVGLIRRNNQGKGKPAQIIVYRREGCSAESAKKTQLGCEKPAVLECDVAAGNKTDINNYYLLIRDLFGKQLYQEYDQKQVDRVLEVCTKLVCDEEQRTEWDLSLQDVRKENEVVDLCFLRGVLDGLKKARFATDFTDAFIQSQINMVISTAKKERKGQ